MSRLETGARGLDAVELVTIAEQIDVDVTEILALAEQVEHESQPGVDLVALRLEEDADLRDALGWIEELFDDLERLEKLNTEAGKGDRG